MPLQEPVQGGTPPPPGRIPNFDHPEDVLHTVNLVSQILAVAFVSPVVLVRLYTRWKIFPPFLIDDWCCVIAFILSILYSCTAFTMNTFGGGYHSWEIPAQDFQNYLKALYADTIVYGPNAWFVKVTLLLVTIRVFDVHRSFVIFGYTFIAAMLGYYLPVLFIKINICRPIRGFWDASEPSQCFNQRAIFVADTVISAVTDTVVLLAPLPVIRMLSMSIKQKIRVYLLLGAGGVATVASFIRMYLVIQLQQSHDQTVDFVRFNLLGTAEVSIGMICACMPTIFRLYQSRVKPEEPARPPPWGLHLPTPKFLKWSRPRRHRQSIPLTWSTVEPRSRRHDGSSASAYKSIYTSSKHSRQRSDSSNAKSLWASHASTNRSVAVTSTTLVSSTQSMMQSSALRSGRRSFGDTEGGLRPGPGPGPGPTVSRDRSPPRAMERPFHENLGDDLPFGGGGGGGGSHAGTSEEVALTLEEKPLPPIPRRSSARLSTASLERRPDLNRLPWYRRDDPMGHQTR